MAPVCLKSILIAQIRANESIKSESLLQNNAWTRSCYELVSKKIHEDLSSRMSTEQIMNKGTSVSYKTLQKVFGSDYNISSPLDPRSLNTLDKLAIFIGFESWSAFGSSVSEKPFDFFDESNKHLKLSCLLEQALIMSFQALSNLSTNGPLNISKYFVKNSSALKRLEEVIYHYKRHNCTLINEYNPSTFELLDCNIESESETKAILKTKEFWRLCWFHTKEERYLERYSSNSTHTYVLIKNDNEWKIKTNATRQDFLSSKYLLNRQELQAF